MILFPKRPQLPFSVFITPAPLSTGHQLLTDFANKMQDAHPPSASVFDLDHAKANNPILHVIPYTSSFTLYRFPPTSPNAPKILAHAFSQSIPTSSSASENPDVSLKNDGQGFLTVTKTKAEISIMVESESEVNQALLDLAKKEEGVVVDGPFGCLRIRGPMELSESGGALSWHGLGKGGAVIGDNSAMLIPRYLPINLIQYPHHNPPTPRNLTPIQPTPKPLEKPFPKHSEPKQPPSPQQT